jgi:basic membrane protein A
MKFWKTICLMLVALLTLTVATIPCQAKIIKVALLLSGPANDGGWNAVALQGLKDAEKSYGIETAYTEHVSVADSEAAFTEYAAQGFDLVIGHGFQYGDPAVRVGKKFPKTKFVAIEGNASSENAASYRIACEEAGYLMGILAASVSKSGIIGMVGGVEQPSIVKVVEAYKRGAKSYRSDIKVLESYISTFTDVAKGKEAAMAMADQGADVLSHIANQAGTGVIIAAEGRGLMATGDSWDQSGIAPKTVVCSTIYNVPTLVVNVVKQVKEGTFQGGIYDQGMMEGVVDIAPYHSFEDQIPQDAKDKVAELKKQLIDGSFSAPLIEKRTTE